MPWTMTLESLVSQIAMSSLPRSRELGGALGRAVHRVHPLDQRVVRAVEDGPAGLGVVAVEADDERLGDLLAALAEQGERLDDAVGDLVAGGDAAEDVDEDATSPPGRTARSPGRWPSPAALAPPPMSRKLAGLTPPCPSPAYATTSSVDMTRPAPLPMMPTSPSSLT